MASDNTKIPVDFTKPEEVAAIVQRAFDAIAELQNEVGALSELIHTLSRICDLPESTNVSSAARLRCAAELLRESRPGSAVLSALAANAHGTAHRVVLRLVASEGDSLSG
jgi:hypothetical protein